MQQNRILGRQAISTIFRSHHTFGWIMAAFVLALAAPLYLQSRAEAQDKRVVSIYVDGETIRLATDAQTVGEALERADVVLGETDLAEPAPDAPIIQDSFNINVYRARPITVIDGQERHHILTAYQSPTLIAQAAGVTVYPEDSFDFQRITDFVGEQTLGLKLIINRATPVTINLYGNKLQLRTHAATINDLFNEQAIEIAEKDIVRPKASTAITKSMTIKVARVGTEIVAEEQTIAFAQETIRDTSLSVGERTVKTKGQNGAKLSTFEVTYYDDKEVSREKLNEVITKQPVTEVVVVGVNGSPSPEAWAALRQCEAGGNYQVNTGNGFYGAYQFTVETWQGNGGTGYPHQASPEVQDEIALRLWKTRGFQPWPACRSKLGLP